MIRERKIKIIFRWSGYNAYTLSVLMGLLLERLDPRKFVVITAEDIETICRESGAGDSVTVLAYSFCTPQFDSVKKEIKQIRKILGNRILIICGGPHATALPQDVLKTGADAVFTGEAEESLPDFLTSLYETSEPVKEKIIRPLPLQDFDNYPPFAHQVNFLSPIEIRRGCSTGCSFCQTPRVFKKIRERSIGYVKKYADRIKELKRDVVYFIIPDALSYGSGDDNVNLDHLETFLREIHGAGLKINLGNFPSEVSPRKLARFPEAASILKKYVRNKKIALGAQSASEKILRIMKRDHNVADIISSAKILKTAGFTPIIDILFGVPGETKQDRIETIRLMNSLTKRYKASLNIHYFTPLPGTPLAGTRPEPVENDIREKVANLMKNGQAHGDFFEQLLAGPA